MSEQFRFRKIVFLKNHFEAFFIKQSEKTKEKIIWTFDFIETNDRIPETILKHVEGTGGLYEIRVKANGNMFRIFCFFEKNRLIIMMNGFQKKSRKTPSIEIRKALQIKADYEKEK